MKGAILAKQIENEKLKTKSRMEKFLEAVTKLPEELPEQDGSIVNENPTTTRSNKTNSTSRNSVFRRSKSIEGKLLVIKIFTFFINFIQFLFVKN